jgi:hypothetical protein
MFTRAATFGLSKYSSTGSESTLPVISSQTEFLELFRRGDTWPGNNIVLLIDEFSELYKAKPSIRDECLRTFHEIINNNGMYAIRSIIAAGTFSIMKLQPSDSMISPFNVADHVQNPSFTIEDVRKLFRDFAQDHCITIDDAVVKDIWAKSNGCVTLLTSR